MKKSTYLTQRGFEKFSAELEHLRTVKRAEVSQWLKHALEEDEDEGSTEYQIAKDEQAFLEGRIRELENLLANAVLIEAGNPSETVTIGSTVVVQQDGQSPEKYTIVGSAEANTREGMISDESPLGRALLNRKVGEEVAVHAPAGILKFLLVDLN